MSSLPNPLITSSPERLGGSAVFELAKRALISPAACSMRVLLDSNLPRAFASLLPGHRTETTHRRGWSDLDDGPLLDTTEPTFDAFVTMDQNLRYQQNSRGRRPRIVVIRARSNRLVDLTPAGPLVLEALSEMSQGELHTIVA